MQIPNQLPQNFFRFIWYFLKDYKIVIFFFVLLSISCGFYAPFNSFLIKKIINIFPEAKKTNDFSQISKFVTLFILNFLIFDHLTWRCITFLNYKYLPILKNKITTKIFEYTIDHSYLFFQNNLSGKISSQISALTDSIQQMIQAIMHQLFRGFSLFIIAFFSFSYLNPRFGLIFISWFVIFFFGSFTLSKKLLNLSKKNASEENEVSGQIFDIISNSNNVRVFARKIFEISRLKEFLNKRKKAFMDLEITELILSAFQGVMIAAMLGGMLFSFIDLYKKNLLTQGDFGLILILTTYVAYNTWFTSYLVKDFFNLLGKCNQSLKTLIVEKNIYDKENTQELKINKGEIIFKNVDFGYNANNLLFKNQSVIIKPGQKVGLVGYSGAGKTTFVNLILRLFDVNSGSILIDGQNISDVKLESLYSKIGLIPQDPILFQRSIKDNIKYGKENATDEEIVSAAKIAGAHDFIENMSDGYETFVGERGVKLSGGQRQRIGIARMILKNAPILILDEATSALDSVTENFIQKGLDELMKEKTVIVIAHRLSTLLKMDRILVFDNVEIIEDGSHSELILKNGVYTKLWNNQVNGFLVDEI